VFQETSVRHTRARTLFCPSFPILLSFFHCHLPGRTSSLFLFRELHQSHFAPGLLFLEPLEATRGVSNELETIPSLSPFFPPSSILSRPPSFYSLDVSSREEKNSRSAVSQSDDRVVALRSATRKINVCVKFLASNFFHRFFFYNVSRTKLYPTSYKIKQSC